MTVKSHDSYERIFTKKVKNIDLSLDVGNIADQIIWQPEPGELYILLAAFVKVDALSAAGTASANRVELEIGTTDLVAAVAVGTTLNSVKTLTVVASLPFDYDNPILLSTIDETTGGKTELIADLILVAVKCNDIF